MIKKNGIKLDSLKGQTIDSGMTEYDYLKQEMKQQKPLLELQIARAQRDVENWFNMAIDSYAMLYCKELSDITLFHLYEKQNENPPRLAAAECIGCLTDRGEVVYAKATDDNAWEFWVKTSKDGGEAHCYFLFGYDKAVIEV